MLIRLLPGMVVGVILAVFLGAAEREPSAERSAHRTPPELPAQAVQPDLSERVLFSGMRFGAGVRRNVDFIPDMRSLGFDEEVYERGGSAKSAAVADAAASSMPAGFETPASVPQEERPALRGGSSETAYASMPPPEFHDIPSGDPPPLLLESLAAHPAAHPAARRGLRVWAGGEALRGRQERSPLDSAAYSMTGTKYSVGLDCDWSVDTTLGLSLDLLDATVKSRLPYDARTTDISGVFAKASADSVLFDSYLLGLTAFYGRLDSRGGGSIASPENNGGTTSLWREPKHRSGMYGLSAALRVPVLLGDFRVVFDAGLDYQRIDSDPYSYRVDASGLRDSSGEAFSSSSLAVPAGFSMERDFVTPWALFTPRLGAGYSHEFSGSAGGMRALNALSAMPVHLQADGFHRASRGFVSAIRGLYRVDLGLAVATAGGWSMTAAYRRDFAEAYRRDTLSVALGRSF